jgi:5-methylthioribose kinase
MYRGEFMSRYIGGIMSDTAGYAGTEIIRRIAGDAKVKELSGVEDGKLRAKMEEILLLAAIELIINRDEIKSGRELGEILTGLL